MKKFYGNRKFNNVRRNPVYSAFVKTGKKSITGARSTIIQGHNTYNNPAAVSTISKYSNTNKKLKDRPKFKKPRGY